MTAIPVCISTECPSCAGAGEVGTGQDHWGNWDTETCRTCDGTGTVPAEQAQEIRDATCIHGTYTPPEADVDCVLCLYARHADATGPNPWRDGAATVVGGWDQEPPF